MPEDVTVMCECELSPEVADAVDAYMSEQENTTTYAQAIATLVGTCLVWMGYL